MNEAAQSRRVQELLHWPSAVETFSNFVVECQNNPVWRQRHTTSNCADTSGTEGLDIGTHNY